MPPIIKEEVPTKLWRRRSPVRVILPTFSLRVNINRTPKKWLNHAVFRGYLFSIIFSVDTMIRIG